VAAVGNQKQLVIWDSGLLGSMHSDGEAEVTRLQDARVWCRRQPGSSEVELCTLDNNIDPSSIFVYDETLMEECLVIMFSR
jgi:hypothetical protein